MKHVLKQMQYTFAVIYGTLSTLTALSDEVRNCQSALSESAKCSQGQSQRISGKAS